MAPIFEIASGISTGVALIAFIVACVLYAYKIRSDNDLKKVESADTDHKVQVVKRLADRYGIPAEKMTGKDAARLTIARIHSTERMFKWSAVMVFFLSLTALVLGFLVFRVQGPDEWDIVSASLRSLMTNPTAPTIDFIEAELGTARTKMDCLGAPVAARMMNEIKRSEDCRYALFDLQDYRLEVAFDLLNGLSRSITLSRLTTEVEPIVLGPLELNNEASPDLRLGQSTLQHCGSTVDVLNFGGNAASPSIVIYCMPNRATNWLGQAFWYAEFPLGWPEDVYCSARIVYFGVDDGHTGACPNALGPHRSDITTTYAAEDYLFERMSAFAFDGYSILFP